MTNPKEKRETLEIPQARPAGKMTKLLREFYISGMKGEASVLATSQGKFCTPEMVKRLIQKAFEETRGEDLQEAIKRQEGYLNNL